MEPYIEKVKNDFESWKVREPGTIEKISGFVGKPVEVVIQPFIEKISPLLEDVLKNSNKYIAEAIVNSHEEIKDITNPHLGALVYDVSQNVLVYCVGTTSAAGATGTWYKISATGATAL